MLELYQYVSLKRDFSKHNLKKGDVAMLIDSVPHPSGREDGYVLEVFNAAGESIKVIIVPMSAVASLREDEIFAVRSLVEIS